MDCQICGYPAIDYTQIFPFPFRGSPAEGRKRSYIEVIICDNCKQNLTDYEIFQLVIEQNKLIAKGGYDE